MNNHHSTCNRTQGQEVPRSFSSDDIYVDITIKKINY